MFTSSETKYHQPFPRKHTLVALCRNNGFAAAFTGSGGAINCLFLGESKKRKHEDSPAAPCKLELAEEERIKGIFQAEGFHFERATVKKAKEEPVFVWSN